MVPLVDLTRRARALGPAYADAAARVVASGQLLLGPELAAFEEELAQWLGARHVVGVASGASAIQLSLVALGVGPGDEVIVPAFTAVPTAAAVCATGATPVFADVDPDTAALDPEAAAAAMTDRTRAVIPVHLYGRPAPLPDLGVPVVEDAAQAHGALDHRAGRGAFVAYSFYPTKNLGGVVDGGAIATDDPEAVALLRRLRTHGMEAQYVHTEVAMSSRLSELAAAWLRLALVGLAEGNRRRAAIAATYREAAPAAGWQADHRDHVHHLAVARADHHLGRDALRAALGDAGVATGVHYPLALTQQPAYRHLARRPCPVAEDWAARCVSLPCFPELTDAEVATVAGALGSVTSARGATAGTPS